MAVDTTVDAFEARAGRRPRLPFAGLSWSGRIALVALVVIVGVILVGPLVYPVDPTLVVGRDRLQPPGARHLMGTDHFGRDVLARVLKGGQQSLRIGLATTAAAVLVGSLVGLVAGYFRRLDGPLMRLMDGFLALPAIILAIAIMAVLGPSEANVVIALAVAYTPRVARVVRGQVLSIRELDYVMSAEALGTRSPRVLWRHVLPNILSVVIVQVSFTFAYAVLDEATLSFIGVGPPPPAPSWGNMLAESRNLIAQAPWVALFPGLAIAAIVLTMNFLGDAVRDWFDPTST